MFCFGTNFPLWGNFDQNRSFIEQIVLFGSMSPQKGSGTKTILKRNKTTIIQGFDESCKEHKMEERVHLKKYAHNKSLMWCKRTRRKINNSHFDRAQHDKDIIWLLLKNDDMMKDHLNRIENHQGHKMPCFVAELFFLQSTLFSPDRPDIFWTF